MLQTLFLEPYVFAYNDDDDDDGESCYPQYRFIVAFGSSTPSFTVQKVCGYLFFKPPPAKFFFFVSADVAALDLKKYLHVQARLLDKFSSKHTALLASTLSELFLQLTFQ